MPHWELRATKKIFFFYNLFLFFLPPLSSHSAGHPNLVLYLSSGDEILFPA